MTDKIPLKVIKDRSKFSKQRVKQIPNEFKLKRIVVEENKIKYRGIITLNPIEFSSKCEHHQVGIHGEIYFAYVPNEYLVGLSHIAKICEKFLNVSNGILQEEATKRIVEYFYNKIKPAGVWVVIKAKHECMSARGVKQRSTFTKTSWLEGSFQFNERLMNETIQLWKL